MASVQVRLAVFGEHGQTLASSEVVRALDYPAELGPLDALDSLDALTSEAREPVREWARRSARLIAEQEGVTA